MGKIQFTIFSVLLLFLLYIYSENGVNESLYETYSCKNLNYILNDLYRGGFYCGSDDKYHYLVIKRELVFTIKDYVKIKTDELTPIKIIKFSANKKKWLKLNEAFHN